MKRCKTTCCAQNKYGASTRQIKLRPYGALLSQISRLIYFAFHVKDFARNHFNMLMNDGLEIFQQCNSHQHED